jgi:hypothetical protein
MQFHEMIEQFTIDFEKTVWPTVEMLERAREEFTDESLACAWAFGGDRTAWRSLKSYERSAWITRYLCAREQCQQTAWMNSRPMWSCECAVGYGRRLKHRGTTCGRCGAVIQLHLKPRDFFGLRSPGAVLRAEEEDYQRKKEMAERWAVEIGKAFKENKPCPFRPAPGFEWLLDWAFEIATVPRQCLPSSPEVAE